MATQPKKKSNAGSRQEGRRNGKAWKKDRLKNFPGKSVAGVSFKTIMKRARGSVDSAVDIEQELREKNSTKHERRKAARQTKVGGTSCKPNPLDLKLIKIARQRAVKEVNA